MNLMEAMLFLETVNGAFLKTSFFACKVFAYLIKRYVYKIDSSR